VKEKEDVVYVVTLRMENEGKGHKECNALQMAMVEGEKAVAHFGHSVALQNGTVRDLVTPVSYKAQSENQVNLGRSVEVKAVRVENGLVRLDLTMQQNEVENASKDGIMVVGKTVRIVQKVKLGNATKLVLRKDNQGAACSWIEVKVTKMPQQAVTAFPYPLTDVRPASAACR
jgi:hypothetical protein